jgi:hypothetical protein
MKTILCEKRTPIVAPERFKLSYDIRTRIVADAVVGRNTLSLAPPQGGRTYPHPSWPCVFVASAGDHAELARVALWNAMSAEKDENGETKSSEQLTKVDLASLTSSIEKYLPN